MEISFKNTYRDTEAENSSDGSVEVFTAGRVYKVSDSFGEKMVEEGLAIKVEEIKSERRTRKGGKTDGKK